MVKTPVWLKPFTRAAVVLALLITTVGVGAAAVSYQLGETIEVSTTGAWDRATIIEVGTAGSAQEGQYKVHFLNYASSYDRWLSPIYFRKTIKPATAEAPKAVYQLDERIEVNTTGTWDRATIIDVGSAGGEHESEYKVHFDGYAANYDRWLLPAYFRKVAGGEPTKTATPRPAATTTDTRSAPDLKRVANDSASAPRLGLYHILSYGRVGNPPLSLGHIELLAGGKYRISHTRTGPYYGEGKYVFNPATNTVEWLSGPCKDNAWGGSFSSEREGMTHKIRLRYTTTATNTID